MLESRAGYEFDGPAGRVTLPDLFAGRSQLLLYHFWFPEDGEPCSGCSMFADQVSELAHLNARDTSLALVSPAPQDRIAPYRAGWDGQVPWYTVVGDAFQQARGTTEYFSLDVLLRDGDRVFLTLRDPLARRRVARQRLDVPRPHAARPPGGVGGHAGRPPPVATYAWWRKPRRVRGRHTRVRAARTGRAARRGGSAARAVAAPPPRSAGRPVAPRGHPPALLGVVLLDAADDEEDQDGGQDAADDARRHVPADRPG